MPNPSNTTRCLLCETQLVKNGRTAAGTQRWKCPQCGASSSRKRDDVTRKAQLNQFLDWLLGKHRQSEIDGNQTGRSFRRRTAWCWELRPRIPATGEIHDVVQVDGFNLRSGWCVLTARLRGKVIAYQWCARESQAAWGALFQRLPAPTVVVCDGGPGMHAALKEQWPNTRVQRCLVHLQRNVRKYVTTRSKTIAGKALWGLALKLTRVKTPDDAEEWMRLLLGWEAESLHLTKERTYRKHADEVPSWARPGQTWWYTHQRLRSGHQVLRRVIRAGHLFTFLDPRLATLQVPSSTKGSRAAPTRRCGSYSSITTACPRRINGVRSSGGSTSTQNTQTREEWPLISSGNHRDLSAHNNANRIPGPCSTTPRSAPTKDSGSVKDGPAEGDTPNAIHTFWPIPPDWRGHRGIHHRPT
ncbi:IS1249 family transposase [Leucobacter denitrificans]|uniref:IS1249 family transposase n=1 Tax=Leucobacter denitrificans TaxID=683042 RepID=A0A7G9S529_9MICO|nr:IS1249 family transposase [Leucobacter denitrificans]QNN62954.1 IS1249 family transposase [Leucobacter denitrificans]